MERALDLPDGTPIAVRPIQPGDKDALQRGLSRLGPESRYRRFLAPTARFTGSDLRYLTEVDHHDHEALVATDRATGEGIGVARYVRLGDDPEAAEFAVAVADDFQARGVGTVLLAMLADRAREEGVARFRGLMLEENTPIQDLVGHLGEPRVVDRQPGTVEVEVDLPEAGGAGAELAAMLRCTARGDVRLQPRATAAT